MAKDKSVLGNLPEEQQLLIVSWLTEGPREQREYIPVRDRIESELGVKVSKTSVADYYHKIVRPLRLRSAVEASKALTRAMVGGGDILRDGAILQCQQKAFEILAEDNPDPDEVIAYLGMTLDAQKIALKREELGLKKRQFQVKTCELFVQWSADERAKAILSSAGTNKEKIERLGQAMFEDWNE